MVVVVGVSGMGLSLCRRLATWDELGESVWESAVNPFLKSFTSPGAKHAVLGICRGAQVLRCPVPTYLPLVSIFSPPASTYFYRGTKYWKFDNERLKTEPGYPKSILRDFMGCHTELVPDPNPRWPDVDRPPFNPDGDGGTEGEEEEEEEEDEDYNEGDGQPGRDVDVVVQIDEYTRTMSVVMVLVLLVLLLCILGLIYVIVQMQRKGAPRMLLYCKRSLQEWV